MLSRSAGDIVSRPSVSAAPLYSFHCSVCACRDAEHREHRVGIRDDLPCPRRDQVFAQAGVIAAQQRDHTLASQLGGAHQPVNLMRGRQAGAKARDLNHDRTNLVVDRCGLERVAEMVEASRTATHDLIERRTSHVLFDRTRQPDYQDSVMRNLRGSDDGEMKRRDHRDRDCNHAESGLQVAGRAEHGADGEQNRDNNP
jgi:hypothetical protein